MIILPVGNADAPGCDRVRSWLRQYNLEASPEFMGKRDKPEHAARPLILLAKIDGEVVGGLIGETQFSWLRVSIMAVDREHRSRGIGRALIVEAEREALRRRCVHSYVDTMSYQAPDFYRALGYTVAGRIEDWDSHGHAKFFLVKQL